MNHRFISFKEVMDRIMASQFNYNMTEDLAMNYAVEFMGIMGCPVVFEDKQSVIEINKWRGKLPCDFYEMNQVKIINDKAENKPSDVFVYDLSTFGPTDSKRHSVKTYKLQNGFIYTSIEKGNILISYQAYKTDEDGYPMIIDNPAFIRSLVDYVEYQNAYEQFKLGRIPGQVYAEIKDTYEKHALQAHNALLTPSTDQIESLARILNSLLTPQSDHKNGFKNLVKQSTLRLH